LLVARRYAQWLNGVRSRWKGRSARKLLPAQSALEAWRLSGIATAACQNRTGDRAVHAAGDPILQPAACDDLEPARPLETAAPPAHRSLNVTPPKDVLSGSVEFAPGEQALNGVSYVSYELDGKPLGLVNVRPFHYSWDTRRASNGRHS